MTTPVRPYDTPLPGETLPDGTLVIASCNYADEREIDGELIDDEDVVITLGPEPPYFTVATIWRRDWTPSAEPVRKFNIVNAAGLFRELAGLDKYDPAEDFVPDNKEG